jgi:uncharacterized protein (UPF0264 family)
MSQLLVSVRNVEEAVIAARYGAELIDIKEPTRGSLGAAEPSQWSAVRRALSPSMPVSVALGELNTMTGPCEPAALHGITLAKLGLAGCSTRRTWKQDWTGALATLPKWITPVAVVYADWQAALAPDPHQVMAQAERIPCGVLLLDTFDKTRGDLFQHLDTHQLQAIVTRARQIGLRVALAGSLAIESIPRALEFDPDWIAVRGAACRASRSGTIDGQCVQQLAGLIRNAQIARPRC